MQKNEMIDLLIENSEITGWSEADRAHLETLEEGGLKRLVSRAQTMAESLELNAYSESDDDEDEDDEMPMPKKGGKKGKKKPVQNRKGDSTDSDEDDKDGETKEVLPSGKKKKGKQGKITGLQSSILQTNEEEDDELTANEEEQANLDEYLANAPPRYRELLTNGAKLIEQQRVNLVNMVMNHENNRFTKQWLSSQPTEVLTGLAALIQPNKHKAQNFVGAGGAMPSASPLRNQKRAGLALPSMSFKN